MAVRGLLQIGIIGGKSSNSYALHIRDHCIMVERLEGSLNITPFRCNFTEAPYYHKLG